MQISVKTNWMDKERPLKPKRVKGGKQGLHERSGHLPRQKKSGFCKWSKESSGFGRDVRVTRTKASINCRIKSRGDG